MKSLLLIAFLVSFSTPSNADQVAICENILLKKDKTSICHLNDLNEDNAKAIEQLTGVKNPDFLAMDTSKPICLNYSKGLHNCQKGEEK